MSRNDLHDKLRHQAEAGLILPGESEGEPTYLFSLCDLVMSCLRFDPIARRRELHRRIAQQIEQFISTGWMNN